MPFNFHGEIGVPVCLKCRIDWFSQGIIVREEIVEKPKE